MKKLLIVTLIGIISGCASEPIETTQSNNGNIRLDLLFEQDGCKMYRFADGGRYIYWSPCSGKTQQDITDYNGKTRTTTHIDQITTLNQH